MENIAQVCTLEEKLFALHKEKEESEANGKDRSEEMAKMRSQSEDLWKQIESLQVCLLLSLHVFCVCTSIHCHCVLHTHNHMQYPWAVQHTYIHTVTRPPGLSIAFHEEQM